MTKRQYRRFTKEFKKPQKTGTDLFSAINEVRSSQKINLPPFSVDIGNLIAILMFSRIVAPMAWGLIADHREKWIVY